ncbi:MAG: Gfo/Idh/MocA family oxidoreductase [Planctomycetales bacterium]|nr:Gfo/Idh/MocA family oxidoreductase [Planctomycetales bacterium]
MAVIGHSGRGDYGHGLDTVWLSLPETELVGVADADPAGLERAKQRLKLSQGFASYRELLKATRPEVVAVCPRRPEQHHAMTMAAIEAGAKGIYVEKPYCRTPAEADEITAACERRGVKLAVAHRNRYHPVLQTIDKLLEAGELGRLLEIRGRGKGDRRGGGEDLWVLGSHVLNLMHYFGGAARTCSARMYQDGRLVTAKDVRPGAEELGPLAGNELHARYEMEKGVVGYFDSIANDGARNFGFGLQLIGSQGVINIGCDRNPLAHFRRGNPFEPIPAPQPWEPISTAGIGKEEPNLELARDISHHVTSARDLLAAIAENRPPLCDHTQGAATVEMICGVFESHRQDGRAVPLPLKVRVNPLTLLAPGDNSKEA